MKLKSILILVVTLIIGFVLGGLIAINFISYRIVKFATEEGFQEKVYYFFDVDDNQKEEMKPIVNKYSKKHIEIKRTFFLEFFNMAESMIIELDTILSDEQKEKYYEALNEHKDEINILKE